MKLLHATTVPSTLNFLRTQPTHLAAHGIEVVLLSSPARSSSGSPRRRGRRLSRSRCTAASPWVRTSRP